MSLFTSGLSGSLLQRQYDAANRFLRGTESTTDLRNLGYLQYCGNSGDCGAGYKCINGFCTLVGSGNTSTGSTGCSSGPNTTVTGPLSCGVCGYDKDKQCPGPKCCRFTAFGVQCFCGTCPNTDGGSTDGSEEGKPCVPYCTTYYASFGQYSSGCSESNTCSECYSCGESNNCSAKTDAPCHCDPDPDESCGRTDVPLECCNYKDTCAGRIPLPLGSPYCYPRFRVGIPRCYDPDYKCPEPESVDCLDCEDFTETIYNDEGGSFELPDGCSQTGYIEGGDRKVYLYRCCDPKNTPECRECSSSSDCGVGQCCEEGQCVSCNVPPSGVPCGSTNLLIYPSYSESAYTKNELCDCFDVRVITTGTGAITTYTNQTCTQIAGVTSLNLSLVSQWVQYGSNVLSWEAGYAVDPSSCTSFTSSCPSFVSGGYFNEKPCEAGSTYMPRNGFLKYNSLNTSTGVVTPIFVGLWGGNLNVSRGTAVQFNVNFQIEKRPRTTNCGAISLPQRFG